MENVTCDQDVKPGQYDCPKLLTIMRENRDGIQTGRGLKAPVRIYYAFFLSDDSSAALFTWQIPLENCAARLHEMVKTVNLLLNQFIGAARCAQRFVRK